MACVVSPVHIGDTPMVTIVSTVITLVTMATSITIDVTRVVTATLHVLITTPTIHVPNLTAGGITHATAPNREAGKHMHGLGYEEPVEEH